MNHIEVFKKNVDLIGMIGEGNTHLVWAVALYLDEPNLNQIASESLNDDHDDKKIDFIRLDVDSKRIVFAQGYYSERGVDKAPANKASDLNTASAWLISGNLDDVPEFLREIIKDCRQALENGDVEQIDLLYVHNLPESINVSRELETVATHLRRSLPEDSSINIVSRELGIETLERLYSTQESSIKVQDKLICPTKVAFIEKGPTWKAGTLSAPAAWLRELVHKYGDDLYSANYRGFLGVSKKKKINIGIRQSAENNPENFWVYNNGITILTHRFTPKKNETILMGASIINGAQTSGSIGSIDSTKYPLEGVNVLCRIIECSETETISQIVKFNNTQNEITTWDQYSNSPEQKRIAKEFENLGREYSLKRGFSSASAELGIEVVAQPLLALQGNYKEANRGKNSIFDSRAQYRQAYEDKKARHILFVFTLARAIDQRRIELKTKKSQGTLINLEEKQLILFRSLRFKHFLISIIGRALESILNEPVDLSQIAFDPNSSKAENKSVNDLIATWLPITNIVITLVATVVDRDISDILTEDNSLEDISSKVSSLIYATQQAGNTTVFESFKNIVCPKG